MDVRRNGFTLVELMVVVAIIGVLAAIAVPSFAAYLDKARAAEATTFLASIRQRQESYRAEFGRYASAPTDGASSWSAAGFTPGSIPGETKSSWPTSGVANWNELGAQPDGPVRFQYATISGRPGTTPSGPNNLGYDGDDFWFVAQARGDLDDDGEVVTFEAYSKSSKVWVSHEKGWE